MVLHTPTDLRAEVLDPLSLTPAARLRLAGLACVRCGSTDALRPAGTRTPEASAAGSSAGP